jgi:hypothetical protein
MVLTCMHNQFRNNNNRAHALYAFLLRGRSFAVVRFWHSEDNVNWISCISGVRTRVLKLKPKMPEIEGILDVCLRPFAYLGSCTNIDWTSTWNVSKLQRGMRLTSNSSFNFCKLWFHFSYRAFALIPQGPTQQKPWRPCWCSRQKSLIKIIFNWTPTCIWRLWCHVETLYWPDQTETAVMRLYHGRRFTMCEVSEDGLLMRNTLLSEDCVSVAIVIYTFAGSWQPVVCVCEHNAINQLINLKNWSVGNRTKWPILNDIIYIFCKLKKT